MPSVIMGRILYANGKTAPGVEVRVFDQDAPGKGDDDLTITAGLSDASGRFQVAFDPGRYMDFINLPFLGLSRPAGSSGSGLRIPDPLDILSPYLRFCYNLDGQQHFHTTPIVPFQNQYHLPVAVPMQFMPSRDGFQFPNYFKGYMLPFTLPFLPDASKVSGGYGLCGGMSAAASDFFLSGRTMPVTDQTPSTGTNLQRYLFRRAIDSFAMGESILRFARWMVLPEDGPNGTYRLTLGEFEKLRAALDAHQLAPIGLVFSQGSTAQDIARKVWDNHQVLAYGYTENPDGSVDVLIYDPNYPKNDQMRIHAERVQVGDGPVYGFHCTRQGGWDGDKPVRGFFPMPYEPVEPPANL